MVHFLWLLILLASSSVDSRSSVEDPSTDSLTPNLHVRVAQYLDSDDASLIKQYESNKAISKLYSKTSHGFHNDKIAQSIDTSRNNNDGSNQRSLNGTFGPVDIVNYNIVASVFNEYYTCNVSRDEEFVFEYTYNYTLLQNYALRVSVSSESATFENPVMVVIKQRRAGQSWQLPLAHPPTIPTLNIYKEVSHIICPVSAALISDHVVNEYSGIVMGEEKASHTTQLPDTNVVERLSVDVSSQSHIPLNFTVVTDIFDKFRLESHIPTNIVVSPSSPLVLHYQFPDGMETVTILVTSNSSVCASVAIQNETCPMWDREEDLRFANYYQTMTQQAAVTLTRERYPEGFFIIIMTLSTDILCAGDFTDYTLDRNKIFEVIATPHPGNAYELVLGIGSGVAFCMVIYFFVFLRLYAEMKRDEDVLERLGPLSASSSSPSTRRSSKTTRQHLSHPPRPSRPRPLQPVDRHDSDECFVSSSLDPTTSTNVGGEATSTCSVPVIPKEAPVCSDWMSTSPIIASTSDKVSLKPDTTSNTFRSIHWLDDDDALLSEDDEEGCSSSQLIQSRLKLEDEFDEASSAAPGYDDTSCGDNKSRLSDSYAAAYGDNDRKLTIRVVKPISGNDADCDDSDPDKEADALVKASKKQYAPLTLKELTKKRANMLERRSFRYVKQIFTLFIMYLVPALQLVVAYKRSLDQTGDLDTCYYNFRCMTPVGYISDFSHIVSNMGYVFLSFLFGGLIFYKKRNFKKQIKRDAHVQTLGTTKDFGLDYSLAVTLFMEGILSACYHVCPNRANYQFDTTFMYVIAVKIMLKLYQRRHPDISASADSVYLFMAAIVLLGVLGPWLHYTIFWLFTCFVHFVVLLVVSCNIYYVGRLSTMSVMSSTICDVFRFLYGYDWSAVSLRSLVRIIGNIKLNKKLFLQRMFLVILANVGNWGFLLYGVIYQPSDYDSFILTIFLFNVIVYVVYYLCMKRGCNETIGTELKIVLVLLVGAWSGAVALFCQKETDWSDSPSGSRVLNRPCVLFNFYDYHDLWHYMSALALFLSFYMISIIDNDLDFTPRDVINVF